MSTPGDNIGKRAHWIQIPYARKGVVIPTKVRAAVFQGHLVVVVVVVRVRFRNVRHSVLVFVFDTAIDTIFLAIVVIVTIFDSPCLERAVPAAASRPRTTIGPVLAGFVELLHVYPELVFCGIGRHAFGKLGIEHNVFVFVTLERLKGPRQLGVDGFHHDYNLAKALFDVVAHQVDREGFDLGQLESNVGFSLGKSTGTLPGLEHGVVFDVFRQSFVGAVGFPTNGTDDLVAVSGVGIEASQDQPVASFHKGQSSRGQGAVAIDVVNNVGGYARIQDPPQVVVWVYQPQGVHLEPVVQDVHSCVGLYQGVGTVDVVALQSDVGPVALDPTALGDVDQELVCENDLGGSKLALGNEGIEKGKEKGIEHHTPDHLEEDRHLNGAARFFEERRGCPRQPITNRRTGFQRKREGTRKSDGFPHRGSQPTIDNVVRNIVQIPIHRGKYSHHGDPQEEQKIHGKPGRQSQQGVEPILHQQWHQDPAMIRIPDLHAV
mmetsp:Transcript_21067/g.45952  ORF Transcript_21067/g.45952 Transcript_21067/m.45952 type:complete len:490 (-) Transcript_21067:338-1807(-)